MQYAAYNLGSPVEYVGDDQHVQHDIWHFDMFEGGNPHLQYDIMLEKRLHVEYFISLSYDSADSYLNGQC